MRAFARDWHRSEYDPEAWKRAGELTQLTGSGQQTTTGIDMVVELPPPPVDFETRLMRLFSPEEFSDES